MAPPAIVLYLEKHITDTLLDFQNPLTGGGTKGVASKLASLLFNPVHNPYKPLDFVRARLSKVTDQLQIEYAAGNVGPWVVPRLASLAFEGVLEVCTAFWLANGQPNPSNALKQEVKDFVAWQVGAFAKVIGAK